MCVAKAFLAAFLAVYLSESLEVEVMDEIQEVVDQKKVQRTAEAPQAQKSAKVDHVDEIVQAPVKRQAQRTVEAPQIQKTQEVADVPVTRQVEQWLPPPGRPPESATTDQGMDGVETPTGRAVAAVERLGAEKDKEKVTLVGAESQRKREAGVVWSLKMNETVLVLGGIQYRCANSGCRPRLSGRERQQVCGRARKKKNDLCVGLAGGWGGCWQSFQTRSTGGAPISEGRESNDL